MAVQLPPFHPPVHDSSARCPVQASSSTTYEEEVATLRKKAVAETRTKVFTIGTRRSKLAMVQAEAVRESLMKLWPDTEVRIIGM